MFPDPASLPRPDTHPALFRLLRYLVVGGGTNLLLYLAYLGITFLGVSPEIATTGAFAAGIAITYLLNRGWTFRSTHAWQRTAPRYVAAYLMGYVVQISALAGLYRLLDIPHPLAQLFAMGLAAVTIFLSLQFWVFAEQTPQD
ncbi:MAG: hypothetical protein CMH94_00265 [Oceanicaulis sp.]|uniref:GtrA/DPMS transmembrane domain-containing protein n=1 Tax=Maricaulis virginensis TaxID=144022 RepID=A0A9W6IMT5_9PROT|nr:GtrA family protein [Maricaulis virginensis]MBI74027.1 hypothetical protein [Oceanicaulis sp.]GLK51930.1 hypothetical protein GCM10017621_14380 [Maricaulis virginensis]